MTTWLRSRRFYAGLLAGLIPFLLIAAQATNRDSGQAGEPQRTVVRTYGACPDSTDARLSAALREALPENAALVETYTGCERDPEPRANLSGLGGTASVPAAPLTGTGPVHYASHGNRLLYTHKGEAIYPGRLPPIRSLSPGGTTMSYPSASYFPPAPTPAAAPGPRWPYFAFVLPVLGAVLDGSTDGTICPGDSGLPTGPMRPRC